MALTSFEIEKCYLSLEFGYSQILAQNVFKKRFCVFWAFFSYSYTVIKNYAAVVFKINSLEIPKSIKEFTNLSKVCKKKVHNKNNVVKEVIQWRCITTSDCSMLTKTLFSFQQSSQ